MLLSLPNEIIFFLIFHLIFTVSADILDSKNYALKHAMFCEITTNGPIDLKLFLNNHKKVLIEIIPTSKVNIMFCF